MVGHVNHSLMGTLGLVFLGGAITMMVFVVLSGLTSTTPLDKTYFLRADTSGITGAKDITQWTFLYICGDKNMDCEKAHPALPFGYAWDSNPRNAPEELIGKYGGDTTSAFFYFVWRFGWVFYLIGIFFTVCAFLSGFFSYLGRLGSRLSGIASTGALLFYTIGVSLMTVEFVRARDVFIRNGRDAQIGQYALAFSWGAWLAIFFAIICFCIGGRAQKGSSTRDAPSFARRGLPAIFRRGRTRSRTPGAPVASGASGTGRQVKDEYR